MKAASLITTAALTGALCWAVPSHAQILDGQGGVAGDAVGGVGGDLGEARVEGALNGQAQGEIGFDRAESRLSETFDGAADAANDARAQARARIDDARDRLGSTGVGVGATANGSTRIDTRDDPSVDAAGGVRAGVSIEQDD
jgi:hypothetical protein